MTKKSIPKEGYDNITISINTWDVDWMIELREYAHVWIKFCYF
jgi:hypothetical protein